MVKRFDIISCAPNILHYQIARVFLSFFVCVCVSPPLSRTIVMSPFISSCIKATNTFKNTNKKQTNTRVEIP